MFCQSYLSPQSLPEVFEIFRNLGEDARIIAGGTDLIPRARRGEEGYRCLVDITGIRELTGISLEGSILRIGASVTFSRLASSDLIREKASPLAQASAQVGSPQIRNQATLVGNLVNASPAADGVAALLALEARAIIARPGKGREIQEERVPVSQFLLGPGKTRLSPGELVIGVEFEALGERQAGAFLKIGRRRSLVMSVVNTAVVVGLRPASLNDSRVVLDDVRIALGSVAPTAVRASRAEAFLRGAPVDLETIRRAAVIAADEVRSRTRREYRRQVAAALVERAVSPALRDLGVILNTSQESATGEEVSGRG